MELKRGESEERNRESARMHEMLMEQQQQTSALIQQQQQMNALFLQMLGNVNNNK
jgi:hypothetical protein